jgi:nitrogen fixation protein FixH
MTARTASDPVIRGRHVLIAMLAFFTLVIGVNVAFTVIAVRSFPGEDERRSYLQGLRYNDVIAQRERERALGWQAQAEFTDEAGPALVVTLADSAGLPMRNAAVTASLRRPASDREDRALMLRHVGNGRYRISLGVLAPGVWRLKAIVERDGERLHIERRLEWPSTS